MDAQERRNTVRAIRQQQVNLNEQIRMSHSLLLFQRDEVRKRNGQQGGITALMGEARGCIRCIYMVAVRTYS